MRRLVAHRFRRTTLVATFCGAALVGMGLAHHVAFDGVWVCVALIAMLLAVRRCTIAAAAFVLLAGLYVGGYRGTIYMQKLSSYGPYVDQTVTVIGTATGDGVYGKNTALTFDVTNIHVAETGQKLTGTIGVSGFGENMVFRGDRLEINGKLRQGTGSHQGWMSFAKLHVVRRDDSLIEKVRHGFGAGMLSALPEPLGSFAMGLLIGQRSGLPESTSSDLLHVGLVHIIAVSGYNLTIILRAGVKLFGSRSKYQTMLFSITLISVFLLLTGSSASIVRASIVSALSIAAWYYGRTFKPVTLILLAAAGTGLVNPLYVWGDMGWYLSFLAFYGVMILGPLVHEHFVPTGVRENILVGVGLESLCAEAMALPLVLHIFGQMSHVSLLANVIIAVLVPLAMLLTMVAGVAGTFLFAVAGWFSWPATILLTYMLDAAHLLASIPGVFVEGITFGLPSMIFSYVLVLGFNLLLYSRSRVNSAIIHTEYSSPKRLRTEFLPAAELH